MNTDYQDIKHKEFTEKIIKIFYRVYNKLGYGFLERVYEIEVGLLLNFGPKPEIKRKVFDNHRK
ncbi:MAG: GxxExxY protein [Deltaproteobacteria bacterium]|nr:GxxExxY protein [Deltaproteobacteria bacterium]